MNSLGMDTATETLCLSALGADTSASLVLRRGLQHSPALLPLVDRLLTEISLTVRDLELIVCSVGPGSFTGIRIGLATARGISFGTGCPVVGVSTLDALALPYASHAGDVYPVIDARKGRFYTALFRSGARVGDYLDLSPGELEERLSSAPSVLLVGPDAEKILGSLEPRPAAAVSTLWDPSALMRLGVDRHRRDGADPGSLEPLYLRESEAEISSGRPR